MRLKYGVFFVVVAIGTLLPIPLAQAHAVLVFSNPAVGAHLSAMPSTVEVEFDGNLISMGGPRTNLLIVTDSSGREIDAHNSKVAGPIVTVGVENQPESGVFTVSWRVVSSDGHPVEGSYQFSVGKVIVSPTSRPITSHEENKDGFWIHHRTHIFLGVGFLLAICIWAGFERARREAE